MQKKSDKLCANCTLYGWMNTFRILSSRFGGTLSSSLVITFTKSLLYQAGGDTLCIVCNPPPLILIASTV